jgi:hypothetical protein
LLILFHHPHSDASIILRMLRQRLCYLKDGVFDTTSFLRDVKRYIIGVDFPADVHLDPHDRRPVLDGCHLFTLSRRLLIRSEISKCRLTITTVPVSMSGPSELENMAFFKGLESLGFVPSVPWQMVPLNRAVPVELFDGKGLVVNTFASDGSPSSIASVMAEANTRFDLIAATNRELPC